ncbi:MAG: polyprenyl synthetase family protein [Candidatus Aminicenantia bacterium]
MINFDDYISRKKQLIERELNRILDQKRVSSIYEPMRYSVFSGGKRFRPLLTLCSGESLRAREDELLPFACAIELIHNYSLIHDDLPSMDNDDFRRGKLTTHKVFGEAMALLAGDGLLTLSFQVLSSLAQQRKKSPMIIEAIYEISKAAGVDGMINGQAMDLKLTHQKVEEKDLIELNLKKTASLITAAVKVGGLIAQASNKELKALENYGQNLGIAFQIIDDLLDTEQENKNSLPRPNYARLMGEKKAREKARQLVDEAICSLHQANINSPCLEYLARKVISQGD